MNTIYIEVITGKYKGTRGYIRRIINGEKLPNECIIYLERKPTKHLFKDSEIRQI